MHGGSRPERETHEYGHSFAACFFPLKTSLVIPPFPKMRCAQLSEPRSCARPKIPSGPCSTALVLGVGCLSPGLNRADAHFTTCSVSVHVEPRAPAGESLQLGRRTRRTFRPWAAFLFACTWREICPLSGLAELDFWAIPISKQEAAMAGRRQLELFCTAPNGLDGLAHRTGHCGLRACKLF